MDPLSLTASCLTLIGSVASVSVTVANFVRCVRDARSDLDAAARELQSMVLELIVEDTKDPSKPFPATLCQNVPNITTNCNDTMLQIQSCLKWYEKASMRSSVQWALSGRDDVEKLRSTLTAHKSALELGLEMFAM